MKIKTFLIAFIGTLIVLLGAAVVTYSQLSSIQEINANELSDKLYQENGKIMGLAMQTVNPATLETLALPESWAEIMVVENGSLKISASTNRKHKEQFMYKLPSLLDQSKGIMAAMQNKKAGIVSTKDYMVAIRPLDAETSLIGFKPKAWEMQLVLNQVTTNQGKYKDIKTGLLLFLAVGAVLALIIALAVSLSAGSSTAVLAKALDNLSLGNFDSEAPSGKSKDLQKFSTAFLRIKASLAMALERIGA